MLQNLTFILIITILLNHCYAATQIDTNKSYKVSLPEAVDGSKSPTSNGMGYVYYSISPIGEIFLQEEAKPGRNIIDIGAGYSNIPIRALELGVGHYTAYDISEQHLQILSNRIHDALGMANLKNISLFQGKAPQDLPKAKHQYDAILADKVIHFMTPGEVVNFIKWAKLALRKGGRIYITAASPFSKMYHKLLPVYISRLKQNGGFPGHFSNIMQDVDKTMMENYQKYNVPNEMILFSRTDLIKLFESHNMKVISSFALKIPSEDTKKWMSVQDDQSNINGIIAIHE